MGRYRREAIMVWYSESYVVDSPHVDMGMCVMSTEEAKLKSMTGVATKPLYKLGSVTKASGNGPDWCTTHGFTTKDKVYVMQPSTEAGFNFPGAGFYQYTKVR